MIDSFGVRLADVNSNSPKTGSQSYENFYDENNEYFNYLGEEFIIFTFVNNKIVFELDLQADEKFITLKKT